MYNVYNVNKNKIDFYLNTVLIRYIQRNIENLRTDVYTYNLYKRMNTYVR